ncbi:SDR family oxidoreductase [Myxococcus stipitatus]|uniref:SDR family oxidoreductase n=1 Tax=Myxococcus stipitatus TaxID=83455 RepID=UPI0031454F7E
MTNRKVALITGANKGIGKHVAAQLGHRGLTVYVGARDAARGTAAVADLAATGGDVRFVPIDVTDEVSIRAAARRIEQEAGVLDILINNAGIALQAARPSETSLARMRSEYEVNVFGVIATTQAFLPLLRRSTSPRIVNVSSGLGSVSGAADPDDVYKDILILGYRSSKSALNMATVLFAQELRSAGVRVNVVDPGHRRTDLNGNAAGAGDPAEGAAVVVRVALMDDGPTGAFYGEKGSVAW